MQKYKDLGQFDKKTNLGYECVTYTTGSKAWHYNGIYHNEYGPAFISHKNEKEWWLNGIRLHKEWFLKNPKRITEMQAWELLEPEELVRLTMERQRDTIKI